MYTVDFSPPIATSAYLYLIDWTVWLELCLNGWFQLSLSIEEVYSLTWQYDFRIDMIQLFPLPSHSTMTDELVLSSKGIEINSIKDFVRSLAGQTLSLVRKTIFELRRQSRVTELTYTVRNYDRASGASTSSSKRLHAPIISSSAASFRPG